jgi:tetratricopeptide (TPR) repeat protein
MSEPARAQRSMRKQARCKMPLDKQHGIFVEAMAYFSESLAISRQRGQTRTSAIALHNMGQMARHQGDYEQAADLYTHGITLSCKLGDQWLYNIGFVGLGAVAAHQGKHLRATRFYRDALTQVQKHGLSETLAECFEGLAGSAALQGQSIRAARLFGAAEELRKTLDVPLPDMVALIQASLDSTTYEAAWLDGRRMPLEEVIAYAMSDAD